MYTAIGRSRGGLCRSPEATRYSVGCGDVQHKLQNVRNQVAYLQNAYNATIVVLLLLFFDSTFLL